MAVAVGCGAHSGDMRPDAALPAAYDVDCSGDFDRAPSLRSGKTPVFPVSMLNPNYIDERRIMRLPLSWEVATRFTVTVDGKATEVRSDATDPPFLATHTNAAIAAWRFEPARKHGVVVPARCEHRMVFKLTR
jgi:hypothetical protein